MRRVAFEIEVPEGHEVDAGLIGEALARNGITSYRITELREPDPNTYHPQRRWLVQ